MGPDGDWFNNSILKPCYEQVLQTWFPRPESPRGSVLDIGCGNGHLARFMSSLGFYVTGIDTSEAMISCSEQYGGENVRYFHGDITMSELDDRAFDVFVINNALQDMPDESVRDILRRMRGLAAKDAIALIGIRHPCFHPKRSDLGWLVDTADGERQFTGQGLTKVLDSGLAGYGIYFANDTYYGEPENQRIWEQSVSVSYNRTLSEYFQLFSDAGLLVRQLHEPIPTYGSGLVFDLASRIPVFLVFELQVGKQR